jgi:hypothetical protein
VELQWRRSIQQYTFIHLLLCNRLFISKENPINFITLFKIYDMDTIIANPKTKEEAKAILDFLKSRKIKVQVYKNPTKEYVLNSLEQGAREVKLYLEGKIKLQNAFDLYNEL